MISSIELAEIMNSPGSIDDFSYIGMNKKLLDDGIQLERDANLSPSVRRKSHSWLRALLCQLSAI